jgi:WD40 repeat protein
MAISGATAVVIMVLLAVIAFVQLQAAEKQGIEANLQQMKAEKEAKLAALANLGAASAVSPDGTRTLQIDPGGHLRVFDLVSGKEVGRIAAGYGTITAAAFSPDANQIAVGSADASIYVYDVATMQEIRQLRGHTGAIRRLTYSPDMRQLASGSDDRTARSWSMRDRAASFIVRADSPVVGVSFSPDGSRLVLSSQDGTFYLVSALSGEIISRH